jgi:hypothetical protein
MTQLPHPAFIPELAASFLREGKHARFSVTGESMRPFIRSGDIVLAIPASEAIFERGDAVFATLENGTFMVHRIIQLATKKGTPLQLRLAGDGMLGHDHEIAADAIIGKIVAIERDGKSIGLRNRTALIWYTLRPVRRLWARLVR